MLCVGNERVGLINKGAFQAGMCAAAGLAQQLMLPKLTCRHRCLGGGCLFPLRCIRAPARACSGRNGARLRAARQQVCAAQLCSARHADCIGMPQRSLRRSAGGA